MRRKNNIAGRRLLAPWPEAASGVVFTGSSSRRASEVRVLVAFAIGVWVAWTRREPLRSHASPADANTVVDHVCATFRVGGLETAVNNLGTCFELQLNIPQDIGRTDEQQPTLTGRHVDRRCWFELLRRRLHWRQGRCDEHGARREPERSPVDLEGDVGVRLRKGSDA